MKKVQRVKAKSVEIHPFVLSDFIQDKESQSSMNSIAHKISKKTVKNLANELGLAYEDKQVSFAKKILAAYLER